MIKAPKFQLAEVKIAVAPTGNLQSFAFEQQPQLQSISGDKQVYVKSIAVYTADEMVISPLSPQNATMQSADINKALLILSVAGVLEFLQVPLCELHKFQGTVAPSQFWPFAVRNLYQIDWTKSQVQFAVPPATPVPFSVLFGIVYDYFPDEYDQEVGYQSIHY
jgi:hypothetical protein